MTVLVPNPEKYRSKAGFDKNALMRDLRSMRVVIISIQLGTYTNAGFAETRKTMESKYRVSDYPTGAEIERFFRPGKFFPYYKSAERSPVLVHELRRIDFSYQDHQIVLSLRHSTAPTETIYIEINYYAPESALEIKTKRQFARRRKEF